MKLTQTLSTTAVGILQAGIISDLWIGGGAEGEIRPAASYRMKA